MAKINVLTGSCHCENLQVTFETEIAHKDFHPRACDCTFCRKHGAAYVSDPNGRLAIDVSNPSMLQRYRQGSNSADFVLCSNCGVLVAVLYENGVELIGAVNSKCLEDLSLLGKEVAVSSQELSASEKIVRWRSVWIPRVELKKTNI